MSIEKSVISAERWRDIATGLAGVVEELLTVSGAYVPEDARQMLAEFNAAADEDDPPN